MICAVDVEWSPVSTFWYFYIFFVLEQEFGYMDRGEERQVIRKETIPKKGNRSELGERSEAQWLQAERVIIFYGSFA